MASRISSSISLSESGKHVGVLSVPYSRDESGWGSLRVPIAVIGSGNGPSVLLVGGNHGDELEGPVALTNFIREINARDVRGRIVVIPALNYPAVLAGSRTSPIDRGNMNRSFPGDAEGTITQQIAHFVTSEILMDVDAVLDIHSGGRTMYFEPFAAIHELDDRALMERSRAAMVAFGAPTNLVLRELDAEGMLDTTVERMNKVFVTTELGGGGSTSPDSVAIAARGILGFLAHFGILAAPAAPPTGPANALRTSPESYVICEGGGLLEFLVSIGQSVKKGQPVCRVLDIDHPLAAPRVYEAGCSGRLLGRMHGGMVVNGDFLAMVAFDA